MCWLFVFVECLFSIFILVVVVVFERLFVCKLLVFVGIVFLFVELGGKLIVKSSYAIIVGFMFVYGIYVGVIYFY